MALGVALATEPIDSEWLRVIFVVTLDADRARALSTSRRAHERASFQRGVVDGIGCQLDPGRYVLHGDHGTMSGNQSQHDA